MLTGTVAGGLAAQAFNFGVPYIIRIAALGITFLLACFLMKDEGFSPKKRGSFFGEVKDVAAETLEFGLRNAPIRWMMLSSVFSGGVAIYAFYAMQPYLLQLYGSTGGYAVAGAAAAVVAGAQIVGGLLVPYAGRIFKLRTSLLIAGMAVGSVALVLIGLAGSFWLVLLLLAAWSIVFAAVTPVRQAYINGIVPSKQRATVLSADNLLNSAGGGDITAGTGQDRRSLGLSGIIFRKRRVFQAGSRSRCLCWHGREKAKSDPIRDSEAAEGKSGRKH